jgi:DNA invertase Pin-like site-specific DNA recombinase
MRRAFSYLRFSKREQIDGRSLKRQMQLTEAYCKRHGLTLDKRTFTDMGVSAFTGGNALAGELADFIELVADGRIPAGSVLIVENSDRLSRLAPDKASAIICDLVRAGVDIHTTSPEATYTADNISKVSTWLPLQVSCALAHEESVKKSERLRDMWAAKRQALADGEKIGKRVPSWLELADDRKAFVVLGDKAQMVRDAFGWALAGLGVKRVCEKLQERHPGGLAGAGWQPGGLRAILRNRAVIGEYQPHVGLAAKKGVKKTRKPVGDPVRGYYPAIIDEATFYQVQLGMDARRLKRSGGHDLGTPNLFRGYTYNAHDGHTLCIAGDRRCRYLVSSGASRKLPGCRRHPVSYVPFEQAVLRLLSELKVSDVTGPKNGAQREAEAASAALTAVNHKIGQLQAKAREAADPSLYFDILDQLGQDRKAAIARLEQAKAKAAYEAADGFGECQTLIGLLRDAPDDERENLRRKTRAALVRLIDRVMVLPVRRHNRLLLVAAQVFFRDRGVRRDYLIVIRHRGDWSAASLPPAVTRGLELDLRRRDHARDLARALEAADLTDMTGNE